MTLVNWTEISFFFFFLKKNVQELLRCLWLICWIPETVLTGNRQSVPKPPVSRGRLLLQNRPLLQRLFQLQLQLRPISMRSLGTAKCKLNLKNVCFAGRKRFLYVVAIFSISRLVFNTMECIFSSRDLALCIPYWMLPQMVSFLWIVSEWLW